MALYPQLNDYAHLRVAYGEGTSWILRAVCNSCHIEEDMRLSNKSTLTQMFADRYFANKGWKLGRDRGHDTCPACIGKRAKLVAVSPEAQKEQPLMALHNPVVTEHKILPDLTKQPAKGSMIAARDLPHGLTWYPHVSRKVEMDVVEILKKNLRQDPKTGIMRYQPGVNGAAVWALIPKSFSVSEHDMNQIRIFHFGPMRNYKKPIVAELDEPITLKEAPAPDMNERVEKDIAYLFEMLETLRGTPERIKQLESAVSLLLKGQAPEKNIVDFTTAELLAEIARRTS